MKTCLWGILFVLLAACAAPAQDVSLDELGCVPGDPDVDNGAIITEALRRQAIGELRGELVLPIGDYYLRTPIYTPAKAGGALRGSGGIAYMIPDSHYQKHLLGGACTRLIWVGQPDEPMMVVRGLGFRLAAVNFVGQPLSKPNDSSGPNAGVGIVIQGREQPPSGKHYIEAISIVACDVAILASDKPDDTHADQLEWNRLIVQACPIVYQCRCTQSVGHVITGLTLLGDVDVVFDFQEGGELSVRGLAMNNGTLLRLGNANANVGSFTIRDVSVDNVATTGFRPLEMTRPADCFVEISGRADRLVKVLPSIVRGRADVVVDIKQKKP